MHALFKSFEDSSLSGKHVIACIALDAEEIAEECLRLCEHFVGVFAPGIRSLELGKTDDGNKGDHDHQGQGSRQWQPPQKAAHFFTHIQIWFDQASICRQGSVQGAKFSGSIIFSSISTTLTMFTGIPF
jgi:hypothetical protein